jgi:hypothetical protein
MTDSTRNRSAPLPGRALLALACALLVAGGLTACGGIGLPGTGGPAPAPYPEETAVTGEVVRVDATDREIEINDAGRRHVIAYSTTTPVYWEGRSYQPSDLERGDVIRARVVEDRYGVLTTDRIDVVESVQSRDGGYDDDPYGDDPSDRPSDRRPDQIGDLSGEIDRVDTDRREIVVRTSSGDRLITYDDRTRVVYQGQGYEPVNLERGDLVEIDTTTSRDSRYALATRIEVTRSVQDRTGYDDRPGAERVAGTVDWIDRRRGEFGLRTDRETLTVEVPFDAANDTRDRFSRLDRGDSVRIEAEELERGRVALVRFL